MVDCFWSLYNTADEVRVDGLRTVQMKALLRGLSPLALSEWLVWQEGTQEWRKATDLNEIIEKSSADGKISAPIAPVSIENATTFATTVDLSDPKTKGSALKNAGVEISAAPAPTALGPKPGDENPAPSRNRLHRRFLLNVKAFVTFQGRVFPNETLDVSVAGMKLKTALPAEITGSFSVSLVKDTQELTLRCCVVKSETGPKKSRLLIESCNRMDVLRTWILDVPESMADEPTKTIA
jgi:hypothetical protein